MVCIQEGRFDLDIPPVALGSSMQQSHRNRYSFAILVVGVAFVIFVIGWFARKFSDASYEDYLVLTNAVLLVLLVVLGLGYADSRRPTIQAATRAKDKSSAMLQHLHAIFYTRTGLSEYLSKRQIDESQLASCIDSSSQYLGFLIDETRAMFENYTDHPCAVSIKLLVQSNDSFPAIETYQRDKKSELARRGLYAPDGRYRLIDHSPFVDIVTGDKQGDFFLSNDLTREEQYQNGNPHWPKLYNATLIVPIKAPNRLSNENILGFLCIDSLTAKFDEQVCLPAARIVANTVFYVISSLSILEERRQSSSKLDVLNVR